MSGLDWVILTLTLLGIVVYGVWSSREIRTTSHYLRGDDSSRWWTVGLSVMATQASAITFLSVPGQAYNDGMRFVQFYFGLPLAMIVISAFILPRYVQLRVFTAYEYLESRFDLRVRLLTAFLFLVSRGLAAGITIYAPSIVLSSLLGWPLIVTNLVIGVVTIVYTVLGGTQAVSRTQKQQMIVIMLGMATAGVSAVWNLPSNVSLNDAARIAGALGRMEIVDFSFSLTDRYNIWSGLAGGFFLALAYFGTDQSQVQRYLASQSLTQSRLGLLFNGVFKVPMQFGILFIGVLVFVHYIFVAPPAFFNEAAAGRARQGPYATEFAQAETLFRAAHTEQRQAAHRFLEKRDRGPLVAAAEKVSLARARVKDIVRATSKRLEPEDSDYIFITFVMRTLPVGLVGLLIAVILSAAMSSTASELNALGATSTIDFYKRLWGQNSDDHSDLRVSKLLTVGWGLVALCFATFATLLDNLIEAVNILGSIFYGPILGIFMTAFFSSKVDARSVLVGAVIGQMSVAGLFAWGKLGFLWYNVVGCAVVIVTSWLICAAFPQRANA